MDLEKRVRDLEAKVRFLSYQLENLRKGNDVNYYHDEGYAKKHGLTNSPVYLPPDFSEESD
jgi:hypothetical protein